MSEKSIVQNWDVIIIGGGPAGYFAAIRCRELSAEMGRSPRVLIIEKARRSLGKVLISGGERCNVTHACFDPARLVTFYPRGGNELRGPFSRFQPKDTVQWFEQRGVPIKTEEDGRMFPASDSSLSIVNCLEDAGRKAGVTVWNLAALVNVEVLPSAENENERFEICLKRDGEEVEEMLVTHSILFASGSEAYCQGIIKNLGHTIQPPVPSLFTFKITDERISELAGVSVQNASLTLEDLNGEKSMVKMQNGPLLITHWGISGPVSLKTSAWGARWLFEHEYQAGCVINWLYPLTTEKVFEELKLYKDNPGNNKKKPGAHPVFQQIPVRLWKKICDACGITENQNWADMSKALIRKLAEELTAGGYLIEGKGMFKDEFVTCGGVRLDEVDFKTMQSRIKPGVFFAGEVLDIDGLTGGFNFQNAWTTGWLAGSELANQ